MEELRAQGIQATAGCVVDAAKFGHYKALHLLKHWGCQCSPEVAVIAAMTNNPNLVSLVYHWQWSPEATKAAAEGGKLSTLRTLVRLGEDMTEEASAVLEAVPAFEDFHDMHEGTASFTMVTDHSFGFEGWRNWGRGEPGSSTSALTCDIRDVTNPPRN